MLGAWMHREPEAVEWSYTIGLVERDDPEVVTLGLPPVHAVDLLNWVHDRDVAGDRLCVGQTVRFDGVAVKPVPVPTVWVASDDNPLGSWFAYYGIGRVDLQPPAVWQLLWAENQPFSGQAGCQRGRSTSSSRSSGTTQPGDLAHRTRTSVDGSASSADSRY